MTVLTRLHARLGIAVGWLIACSVAPGADVEPPRILVALSYHVGMPWTDEVSQGLSESIDGQAELVFTQFDVKRHPAAGRTEGLLALAGAKVEMSKPQLIVAIDDFAYGFVLEHRELFGADRPIVFGGVNFLADPPPRGVTGVIESLDLANTMDLMVALQPGARRWVIVNDASETGLANRQALERALAHRNHPEILWIGEGTFAETERDLARLDPRDDAVLLLTWNLDRAGSTRSHQHAAEQARSVCPAPLYGVWGFDFGHGILGGALLDGRVHGREIGGLVKRVLAGQSPDAIPVVERCRTDLRVDARELERFGFARQDVPPGTDLAFQKPGLWTEHGATLLAVAVILALQTGTISWLLFIRRLRRQALQRLSENETALRVALHRLETAQEQAKIGSWEIDRMRRKSTWSKQMFRLFGLPPADDAPKHPDVLAMLVAGDRDKVEQAMDRAFATGLPTRITLHTDPAQCPARVLRATMQTRPDPATGEPIISGTLQDVTLEVEVQASAEESRQHMTLALQGADLGIWDWHIPSRDVNFSDRCVTMLGYTREQIAAQPVAWDAIIHPDDLPHLTDIVRGYRTRRMSQHEIEFRARHASGTWSWIQSKGKVIAHGPDGAPLRAAGTHLDITERRRREEVLRSTERKLAEIFRSSPEIIALTRASDGRFIEINEVFSRLLGFSHDETVGHTSIELNLWPSADDRARLLESVTKHGGVRNLELTFRRKDGCLVPFLVSANQITIEDEPCLVWLLTDITERRHAEQERTKLQEQLLHAMKMEAVGRLAGGVAHDFNNLLTVISGNVEFVREGLPADDPRSAHLAEIAAAAASAAGLTRQLLSFSRRQIIEPRVLNLNELLENLRAMVGRLIGEDITFDLHLAPGLSAVRVDAGQFEQVVINLAVNARDAMTDGGRLTITTANVEFDAGACAGRPGLTPGSHVMLSVADTGHGMPAEVKQRLFEPFFTTKPVGRGTGLGLSMIFGAVKQAGGVIEVESEPGRGSEFRIYLPPVDQPTPALAPNAPASDLPRGSETVLLVEDDDSVRALAARLLKRLGYRVLSASDGYEAVELARGLTDSLDLLLADLVMPGISGRETSERVRALHPEAAVLFSSGYTEDAILRQGVMTADVPFISKPYSLQSLAARVRQVLDAGTRGREST